MTDEPKVTDLHNKNQEQGKKIRKAKEILAEIKAAALQKEANEFKTKLAAKLETVEKHKAMAEKEQEELAAMMEEFDEKMK